MLKKWLRQQLGMPTGPLHGCPNKGCMSLDTVLLEVISRPRPGEPWKHDPVGSHMRCTKCGEHYVRTVDEVYTPYLMAQDQPARRFAPQPDLGARDALEGLFGDLRHPSAPA